MEISTTNSSISSSSVQINKSATVPIIDQRRANTTVSVQSGQTVIIGGLIQTVDDKRVKKLPVLGEIPYLGVLFRTTRSTKNRKELLILLTPQIVANEKPAEGDSMKEGVRLLESVTREQLNGSRIRGEIKRDDIQRKLLDPIFPPEDKPLPEGRDPKSPAAQRGGARPRE
jgi:type II secretory pathway component GspD/PulD (secretin)